MQKYVKLLHQIVHTNHVQNDFKSKNWLCIVLDTVFKGSKDNFIPGPPAPTEAATFEKTLNFFNFSDFFSKIYSETKFNWCHEVKLCLNTAAEPSRRSTRVIRSFPANPWHRSGDIWKYIWISWIFQIYFPKNTLKPN